MLWLNIETATTEYATITSVNRF